MSRMTEGKYVTFKSVSPITLTSGHLVNEIHGDVCVCLLGEGVMWLSNAVVYMHNCMWMWMLMWVYEQINIDVPCLVYVLNFSYMRKNSKHSYICSCIVLALGSSHIICLYPVLDCRLFHPLYWWNSQEPWRQKGHPIGESWSGDSVRQAVS